MTNDRPVAAEEGDSPTALPLVSEPRPAPIAATWQGLALAAEMDRPRAVGDQVNRFLLCALVSKSAKQIKTRAGQTGESLPMATLVRGVLRAYRVAATDRHGPLSEATPDFAGLERLNRKVLRDEVTRQARDRVKNSEASLARARRFGDDAKIKAETERLEHAVALRDRLAEELY